MTDRKRIVINPVTRLSGFMELDVSVENNKVVEAKTKGVMFRGFEQMMLGRSPFDAIYLTQRICGICSTAHSVASSTALEEALGVEVTEQGRYIRDIIHCCEFLQNHMRHFYQYSLPDFVKLPPEYPLFKPDHKDYRIPKEINDRLAAHYFESLTYSRLSHQMLAVLGGKAPHNHGIFVGGFSTPPDVEQIVHIKSILDKVSYFIEYKMIPDTYTIAKYYPELFKLGRGPGNFMSYGSFEGYKELGTLYAKPLVYHNGHYMPFESRYIEEKIRYSWYRGKESAKPFEEMPEPDMDKEDAYSWVKAPRYNGSPMEVGPLARLWLSGEYRNGISAMDRTIARSLEARKITDVMNILIENVTPGTHVQKQWQIPDRAQGSGLIETTRGSLGHWLKIEKKAISFYQIITPSAWDFSASDENSNGTAELALFDTTLANPEYPVELGRILRSFDPCMSCATHVYRPGQKTKTWKVFG
ncbi:nickel-dependent hydrogenase large subunit [Bacillus sp. REN3]|uniref:nickel-dependent hydrogenase large subunit n=1 Tax=Bacillus sp. REN3 TaxID=2802440 RepID=UPI001AEDF583|nr:nickel-dependent hydrogenase large subunit [Bacillus sp. REN3]